MAWFAVRCIFAFDSAYEERITIWQGASADDAIALAEAEAREYVNDTAWRYLGFAQSYAMFDQPVAGAEIFSLIRSSDLAEEDYLDAFFDTGAEHQSNGP